MIPPVNAATAPTMEDYGKNDKIITVIYGV
jgi:hypothetical protein